VALAVCGDGAGQRGDGLGQSDGCLTEAKTDFVGVGLDVLDGHPADRRRRLGIEEKQQSGEAVFGLEVVIVQKAACDVPAVLLVQWLSGSAPADGRDADGGELVVVGPADEVACLLPAGGRLVGQPAVEVGLSTGAQGEVVRVEPVEERDGATCPSAGGCELLLRGGAAVVAAAQASDQMPDRVALQGFPLFAILCRSKSHRCWSSGMSVLIDKAAEDAGAEHSEGVGVVCRGGVLLGFGW
jgi:hypothetical protein